MFNTRQYRWWAMFSVSIGCMVVMASLYHGQQTAVWGRENELLDASSSSNFNKLPHMQESHLLPPVQSLPGEWSYMFDTGEDWLWVYLAKDTEERVKRQLYLANERLQVGLELCDSDQTKQALQALMSSQIYLQKAADDMRMIERDQELYDKLAGTAKLHQSVLKKIESSASEQIKPKITEMIHVASGLENM